jgi:photosystem II stability/assembly factor-like uncharacterized protein
LSAQVGWAAGENGTILKTTNGGQSWQQQTSWTTSFLTSITFTDLNALEMVGNDVEQIDDEVGYEL